MTEALADALVPIAAELIGTIRDYGPDDVAAVLAKVPDGRHDALAVVLAAMVDPDARPSQLLAWTELGPVASREWESPRHRPDAALSSCPECAGMYRIGGMARHRRTHGVAQTPRVEPVVGENGRTTKSGPGIAELALRPGPTPETSPGGSSMFARTQPARIDGAL